MSDPNESGAGSAGPADLPASEAVPTPRPRRSWAWLAWIVIIGVCSFMALGRSLLSQPEEKVKAEASAGRFLIKMQGRYIVGAKDFLRQEKLTAPIQTLRQGDVEQRLRFVVLAGELDGPGEALKELKLLDKEMAQQGVKPSKDEAKTRELLGRLYRDYRRARLDAPSLTAADRAYLRKELDWFGELALAPAGLAVDEQQIAVVAGEAGAAGFAHAGNPEPELRQEVLASARRTFASLFGVVAAVIFLGFFGFIGLIVLLSLALAGYAKSGVRTGSGHGAIYAETFAVWLVLYPGLSLAASQVSLGIPYLLQISIFMLLSLLALGWPVLCGIPWRTVRADVGLTLGRNPTLEPVIGVACYIMNIPILIAGLAITLALFFLQQALAHADTNSFSPGSYPSHPIVGLLAHGTPQDRILVIILASVVAPIVEETMFRGVLYRHLREASGRLGTALSFIISAAVVSFLFAVIHPQGLIAVPALMAIAFGLTLAREWRGTLVPGMVGHALNNGLVALFLLLVLAD